MCVCMSEIETFSLFSLFSLSLWQAEQKDLFFDRLPLSRGHKICISFHLSGLVDYPAVCLVTEILYILHLWVLNTNITTTGVFLRFGMCWRVRGFITWLLGILKSRFFFSQRPHFRNQQYHNKEVTLFIFASFCDKSTSNNKVGSLPLLFDPVLEGRRDGRQEKKRRELIKPAKTV